MNTTTIVALLQALLALVPQIPELVSGVNTAADLISKGRAPTADEQASIDAALDKAHAALQAA